MRDAAYAKLILEWARNTFGPVAMNPVERGRRLLEEAAEVAQALGVPAAQALLIVERTNGRPTGDVDKEVGGLLVTVYAVCGLRGKNPQELLSAEVGRVLAKDPWEWRAKHAAKVVDGTAG